MSAPNKVTPRKRKWARRLLVAGGAFAGVTGALLVGIHEIPWLGPALADGVRSVVGPKPVAWAEDVVYGAEDWVNLRTRAEEKPKTFWAETEVEPIPTAVPDGKGGTKTIDPMEGAPPPFVAPYPSVASDEDGKWVPMRGPHEIGDVVMWKSVVHPDPKRPFAAVAVVAVDRQRTELHLVAGTDEPKSREVPRSERTGLIPETAADTLVAAFNGGFKAMHGNYGMRIAQDTFIPPRDIACTVAANADGNLTVRTFSKATDAWDRALWYRQTPPCLVEQGEPNPGLLFEFNKNWGAAVGGDTIIRRSAFGVSKDGKHFFYGLGDAVTAQSIGRAMLAVGAWDAAQLDVNYSYPRFLLFDHGEGGASATHPIIPDIKYSPSEYVRTPAQRDFFYVTKKREAS
ncbi:MAG TPA: phosphodiester glycosidase family protein [Polyangiaceae bacterium]|nr:phosphodiester glycosidase family protein [Polyangiaceae bacterium]